MEDKHTLAAQLKKAKAERLNGFKYWGATREDGRILLSDIREEYPRSVVNLHKKG